MVSVIKYAFLLLATGTAVGCSKTEAKRPNILFVIADDQSYPDASAYGSVMVETPGFDFIANHGALYTNAYVTSPGCSPSRASILTGLYPWQIEEAGSHASSFSSKYICFPDILQNSGYHIGYTGKGWGPGNWKVSGRKHNPAGPEYNSLRLDPPYSGLSKIDYTANFKQFLTERKKGQPFYFWMGTHEPHRPYENKSWIKEGYALEKARVPYFLPGGDTIKSDMLDYAVEIGWFDKHLMNCINELKRIGEFENTIIIVTADNGMSFPRAKANCYDAGIHVPLAICWGDKVKPSQIVETLVSSVDFAPTILDAVGLMGNNTYSGESQIPLLTGRIQDYKADAVYAGRERHSFSRNDNLGYPMRSVRWKNYLLVRNFHPERWPAGDPEEITKDGILKEAYYDIDDAPSKTYLIEHRNDPKLNAYFKASVDKRTEYELYDLKNDIDCIHNMAANKSYTDVFLNMKKMLNNKLMVTKDTRLGDNPEIWESYPRLEGKTRKFPDNN